MKRDACSVLRVASTLRSAATQDGLRRTGATEDGQHAPRNTPHVSRFPFPASRTLLPLLAEKLPFFMLSGISCFLTYWTDIGRPQAASFEESPALLRLENAFVACARYLGKSFWPVKLAVPWKDIQLVRPQNIGWRGLFVYGRRIKIVVSGWPEVESFEFAERSSWVLPASRAITRRLYERLSTNIPPTTK